MIETLQDLLSPLGTGIVNLLIALLILVLGYIVARIIAAVVRRLLKRTELDDRLGEALSEPGVAPKVNIEDVVAKTVFWIIMLFVLVAFFQQLGLSGVSEPISVFLRDLTAEYLPRLAAAALLLIVAWAIATVLRFLVRKGAALLKIDERLSKYGALEEEERVSVSESLATAVFWFIFLLFLPSVLTALGISQIADPIKNVFDQILTYIPNVLGATLVLIIGWFIARVIRQIATNLLAAIGTDKAGERVGLTPDRPLSGLIGTVLYIFILLVAIISALEQLNIAAISEPTTRLLSQIIAVVPSILGAALVLVISYAIARLVANLVKDLLTGVGFDTLPKKLSIQWDIENPPSQWVSYLILIVIMLFAATSAAEILGSDFLVNVLNMLIGYLGQVVLSVVIFAIGLYLANLAHKAIIATGTNQAHFLASMSRIAVLVFAAALAMRELGIADDIINLAFSITLGAIGVAIALAFGLGSTKIAERELNNFITQLRSPDEEEKKE